MTRTEAAEAAVVEALSAGSRRACFVTEAQARLRGRDLSSAQIDEALSAMADSGRVLITPHVATDPHLRGYDFRIVSLLSMDRTAAAAREEHEALWREWLKEYLRSHRCT